MALILGAGPSSAQRPALRGPRRIDVWTSENGLPDDLVLWKLLRSPDGYLWMRTLRGLTRFDGTAFAVFDENNTAAFAGTGTLQRPLLVDHRGRLWIATSTGLVWYADGRFHQGPGCAGVLIAMAEGGDGTLWGTSTTGKVFRSVHNASGERMEAISQPGFPANTAAGVSTDGGGAVWILFDSGGVARVTGGDLSRPVVRIVTRRDGLGSDSGSAVSQGPTGTIWIAGKGHLTRIRDGRFTVYPRPWRGPDSDVYDIAEGLDGTVWLATWGAGLVHYDPRDGRLEHIRRTDGLSDDHVYSVFVDPHGSIWAATSHGLNRIRPAAFTTVFGRAEFRDAAPACLLRGSPDGLWVSTAGALFRAERADLGGPLDRVALPRGDQILSIAVGAHGVLWLVTRGNNLVRVDQMRARPFALPSGKQLHDATSVFEDSRGTLWIGRRGAVTRVRAGRDTTLTARDGLHGRWIQQFAEGRDGAVWAGGIDGVTRIANDGVRAYPGASSMGDSVTLRSVQSMYRDRDGTVWVGTFNGLTRIHDGPGAPQFATIHARQGLPDNVVAAIVDDDRGHLWITGLNAIARVPLAELNAVADRRKATLADVAVFGPPDELSGGPEVGDLNCPRAVRGDGGRLWFAAARGVATVDPGHLPRDTVAPQVHVETALVDGVPAAFIPGVTLPADARRLELRYTGVDLRAAGNLRFAYQLDGFDPAWIDAGTARSVSYTNLPPGRYHFRVRARTTGGIWSANVAAVELRMLPPFYRTWWFALGAASLVLAALWAAYQAREHVLRARFAAVADERMRLAREMHDTLAQGLAGVVWQLAAARETLGPTAAAAAPQLDLADQVARETLRRARHAIAALRPGQRNAETLDAALRRVVAERERGGGTRLVVAVAGTPRPAPPDVEFELLRITQAALDNAIVHANAHRVLIEIVFEPGGGVCATVADDGCGFDVEAPHPGRFGLVGMSERAARIGAELTLVSSPGEGAEVVARWSPPVS